MFLSLSAKGGPRFYLLNKSLGKSSKDLSIFLDFYATLNMLTDFNNNYHNNVFWNNYLKYGAGGRVRFEIDGGSNNSSYSFKLNYVNLDIYSEYIAIDYLRHVYKNYENDSWIIRNFSDNVINNISEKLPRDDFKTGLNSWMFLDNKNKIGKTSLFWGLWFNMFTDLSYSRTNFFEDGKDDFLIFNVTPKGGVCLTYDAISLEPYYVVSYVRDLLNSDWNKETWSNNVKYGYGARLSLGGILNSNFENIESSSIFIFGESLNVDYHSRVGDKAEGLVDRDYRVGINFWIPFGATANSEGERR